MNASSRHRKGNGRRLRAAASFQGFQPCALACCPIIECPQDDNRNSSHAAKRGQPVKGGGQGSQPYSGLSIDPSSGSIIPNRAGNAGGGDPQNRVMGSICAVAGPEGIACFHSTTPNDPYTILRHVSPATRHISALAFQPMCLKDIASTTTPPPHLINPNVHKTSSRKSNANSRTFTNIAAGLPSGPLLLASAAGNGVMIWDASGHALSPLLARLTCSATPPSSSSPSQQHQRQSPLREARPHHRATSVLPSSPSTAGRGRRPHRASSSLSSSQFGETLGAALTSDTLGESASSSTAVSVWDEVTSICWKPSTSSPCLITSSTRQVSLWDLRTSMCKGNIDHPSHRLATIPSTSSVEGGDSLSKFVHVCCSANNPHHVAVMDIGGIVQVFDDRMVDRNTDSNNVRLVGSFQAYTGQGVGITSILPDAPSRTTEGNGDSALWVTWGWDADDAHSSMGRHSETYFVTSDTVKMSHNCTAKVWSERRDDNLIIEQVVKNKIEVPTKRPNGQNLDADEYWYFDASSAENSVIDEEDLTTNSKGRSLQQLESADLTVDVDQAKSTIGDSCYIQSEFELVTHLRSHPINCVRACPVPFRNSFVTVGPAKPRKGNDTGKHRKFRGNPWKAQMWNAIKKSKKSSENSLADEEQLIKQVSSFNGGGVGVDPAMDYLIRGPPLRGRADLDEKEEDIDRYGTLLGAELSLTTLADQDVGVELDLCCLSSKGFITNHVSCPLSSICTWDRCISLHLTSELLCCVIRRHT
jgi:hypothetical protein